MNRKWIDLIGPLAKYCIRLARRVPDRRVLNQLSIDGDPLAARIGAALQAADAEAFDPADADAIAWIESQRTGWRNDRHPFVGPSNQEWAHAQDQNLRIRDVALASKDQRRAGTLYQLVRALQPRCAVELGTNIGVSAAYQALAQRHGPDDRQFHTFDMSPARLAWARDLHSKLPIPFVHYHAGRFQDTLADALGRMPSVDYAFIDGHHQHDPTRDYMELLMQHTSNGSLFVFDDIRWNAGMAAFWRDLRTDNRFCLLVDLFTMGIGVVHPSENATLPRIVGPLFRFL